MLASMREFGVTLEEGLGAFEDAMVEKGRIKAVGKFTCTFQVSSYHLSRLPFLSPPCDDVYYGLTHACALSPTVVVKLRNIGQSIPVQVEVREER